MVSFSGEVSVSLTKEELEVLLSVIEGAITDCYYEVDDPSEAVMSVWRKVAILLGMTEASGQGSLLRGGDSFDPRCFDIERPGWDRVERIRPLDLDGVRGQE